MLEPEKRDLSETRGGEPVQRRLLRKLRGSGFFMGALVFHLAVLIVLGGIVIIEYVPPPDYGEANVYLPDENESRERGEPIPFDPVTDANVEIAEMMQETHVTSTTPLNMENIIMSDAGSSSFTIPPPGIGAEASLAPGLQESIKQITTARPVKQNISAQLLDKERLNKIRERIGQSENGKGFDIGQTGRNGVGGVQAIFTCYVARYAGGDWDHNVTLSSDGQRIIFGAIPNLMTQITRWNKRLKANVEAVPLDLSDRAALFDSKPPVAFVYFTGHRDFRLTDTEVGNLREFIVAGGVIWGDAGMPGRHSRFDTAFRREMRRVLPDADQEFQPLDERHEVFQQKGSLAKTLPGGMNFYREPVEVMMVGDQIGVLYTLNSYGNLWQMALDEQGKILEVFDEGTEKSPSETFTNRLLWQRRATYYRNVDQETVTRSYQLGMNIIVHILLQYQDALGGTR